VDAVGDGPDRDQGEELAEQGVQGVARRLGEPEEVAGHDEQPVVLERDGAWCGDGVHGEQQQEHHQRVDPVSGEIRKRERRRCGKPRPEAAKRPGP
jgi:hypothetical protein